MAKDNSSAPAQFKKTFKRLSAEQQEVIADLVYDIEQGNVNPVNVANGDAARIVHRHQNLDPQRTAVPGCTCRCCRVQPKGVRRTRFRPGFL